MKDSDVIFPDAQAHDTHSSLLERLRDHDAEGWKRFVLLYSPLIVYWCRNRGLQEADVQDVGQEVFRAVNRAIRKFTPREQPGGFRGWLRAITQNKARDYLRGRQRSRGSVGSGDPDDLLLQFPAAEGPDNEARERLLVLRRAIDLVLKPYPARTRDAFLAVVLDGNKVKDVAKNLGMTPNAVYINKCRILRRLREEFDGLVEFQD